jgi:hypothetical protein
VAGVAGVAGANPGVKKPLNPAKPVKMNTKTPCTSQNNP